MSDQGPEQDSEEEEEEPKEVEKQQRQNESQEIARRIVQAAREDPAASVSSLAKQFDVSRNYARRVLKVGGVVLVSQQEALEAKTPREEVDGKIIQQEVQTAVSAQTRSWAASLAHDTIEDQRLTGEVVCNELRPIASARGMMVIDLIRQALEAEKTLQALKDQYGPQASDFGYGNVLEYAHLALRFHRENHSVPLEMELVKKVAESVIAEREYKTKVDRLVGLLISGRKEDKMKFLLETEGERS